MGTGERLESFIKNNRKSFDELEPPELVWDKIEFALDADGKKSRNRKLHSILKLVATIILVGSAAIICFKKSSNNQVDLADINPKLAEKQVVYTTLIANKQHEITAEIKHQDPQLYNDFEKELVQLQGNYNMLQNDLKNSPNQELTLQAMIRNLQVQTDILNQQLLIIEQLKKLKYENGTNTTSQKGI